MPRLSLRFDEVQDAALWACIQAIPAGQRHARLKQVLERGLRTDHDEVPI